MADFGTDFFIHKMHILFVLYVSRSAHQTTNFTNSEFQFPEFKVLLSCFYFFNIKLYWHFWVYCDINLKLLTGENNEKSK